MKVDERAGTSFMARLFMVVAPASAARRFRRGAEQGVAKAQLNLAAMYGEGMGVLQDNAEAAKWYRKAAEQGLVKAQLCLAAMYDEGWGIPQDYAEAAKWYREAAEQGLVTAMLSLGIMYYNGRGVPQDLISAWAWFDRAASQSPPGPDRNKAVRAREAVAAEIPEADVDEYQAFIRDLNKPRPEGTAMPRGASRRRGGPPNRTEGERP